MLNLIRGSKAGFVFSFVDSIGQINPKGQFDSIGQINPKGQVNLIGQAIQ